MLRFSLISRSDVCLSNQDTGTTVEAKPAVQEKVTVMAYAHHCLPDLHKMNFEKLAVPSRLVCSRVILKYNICPCSSV